MTGLMVEFKLSDLNRQRYLSTTSLTEEEKHHKQRQLVWELIKDSAVQGCHLRGFEFMPPSNPRLVKAHLVPKGEDECSASSQGSGRGQRTTSDSAEKASARRTERSPTPSEKAAT